jgi:hypothetical protein
MAYGKGSITPEFIVAGFPNSNENPKTCPQCGKSCGSVPFSGMFFCPCGGYRAMMADDILLWIPEHLFG